jgi:transcriptional regulator with XRE-family HTH domain
LLSGQPFIVTCYSFVLRCTSFSDNLLEPGYQIARLRIQRGLTQAQLAEMVGTRQPSIARLENGNSVPSLSFLKRIADALDARIELRFIPQDAK